MNFDRQSRVPLYMQLKDLIIKKIQLGEYKPGSMVRTEHELCEEYGISRYPVRQALGDLADEGYIIRVRGRGTFVNTELPDVKNMKISTCTNNRILGLILPHPLEGVNKTILIGFEKQARERNYIVTTTFTSDCPDEELECIERLIEANVTSIFVFPVNESRLSEKIDSYQKNNIYIGILDRNPGIEEIDYVGSDNFGGAYMAVKHVAFEGFNKMVFLTYSTQLSSIKERIEGYRMGVNEYNLKSLGEINIESNVTGIEIPDAIKNKFIDVIHSLKEHIPFAVVAVNDTTAIHCIRAIQRQGLIVGKDVAVIGFDNHYEGVLIDPPLTTVEQNGRLIGQTAADIMIDKIEGKIKQIHKTILPTQLIIRASCGERL